MLYCEQKISRLKIKICPSLAWVMGSHNLYFADSNAKGYLLLDVSETNKKLKNQTLKLRPFHFSHLFLLSRHQWQRACVGALCVWMCERGRERPGDHEEQQKFPSLMNFAASPMNHDPVLTSSCAYVLRIDLKIVQQTSQ